MAMNMLHNNHKSSIKDVNLSKPREEYHPISSLNHTKHSTQPHKHRSHIGSEMYRKYYKGTIFLRVSKSTGAMVDAMEDVLGKNNQASVVNELIHYRMKDMPKSKRVLANSLYKMKLRHFK